VMNRKKMIFGSDTGTNAITTQNRNFAFLSASPTVLRVGVKMPSARLKQKTT
jgi:hypothetical protein